MTKCSNYAHDKALMGGVAVPDPDELLADIMALETWRAQIEKRSGRDGQETAFKMMTFDGCASLLRSS
jgi:hypothetical protein